MRQTVPLRWGPGRINQTSSGSDECCRGLEGQAEAVCELRQEERNRGCAKGSELSSQQQRGILRAHEGDQCGHYRASEMERPGDEVPEVAGLRQESACAPECFRARVTLCLVARGWRTGPRDGAWALASWLRDLFDLGQTASSFLCAAVSCLIKGG